MNVNDWKERAAKLNVSMAYLCGVGGIDTSTMQRWKKKLPSGVTAALEIENHLKELEAAKNPNIKEELFQEMKKKIKGFEGK